MVSLVFSKGRTVLLFSLLSVISFNTYSSNSSLILSLNGVQAQAAAESAGLKTDLQQTKSGSEYLSVKIRGRQSAIMLLDCESKQCQVVRFYTIISQSGIAGEKINNWNTNYRYARVYLQGGDKLIVEADLALHGGVTQQSVSKFLKRQELIIESVEKIIEESVQ